MTEQLTLFDLQKVTSFPVPAYTLDPYWDEIDTSESQNSNVSVGEQVLDDTAHQHEINCSPTHFVEIYWVQRSSTRHYYFRYTWMEGRKLRRKYIGSTTSKKAIAIVEKVKEAIAMGEKPQTIVEIISA
jgi:hypothetical protein